MSILKGICILSFLVVSCSSPKNQMESPLAVVVKLKSAEAMANLIEAKRFIDIERVYSKDKPDSLTAEEAWKTYVMFGREIANDKKFTNIFKYHNYIIKEQLSGNSSKVFFDAIDSDAEIRKIIYSLEVRNSQWIVVAIDYERK